MTMKGLDNLDPMSYDIISRQPTLIVGLVGHQHHGKTTLANELSGFQVFPLEPTTKLSFATTKIYKCKTESCSSSTSYLIKGSEAEGASQGHENCQLKLMRHLSLIDCPGHPNFLPTVLTAIGVLDAAVLLVSAKENCGQPQTSEHLLAMEIKSVPTIIVVLVQSKNDVVSTNKKLRHIEAIKGYVEDTAAKNGPILEKGENFIDAFCKAIIESVHMPERNLDLAILMVILQSSNVSGTSLQSDDEKKIITVHGVVLQGVLKPNQRMELKPGIVREEDGVLKCEPINALAVSVSLEEIELPFAIPGGVVSLHLTLDCNVCPDTLCGRLLGEFGTPPNMFAGLTVEYILLPRIFGLGNDVPKPLRNNSSFLTAGEQLLITIGMMSTRAVVERAGRNEAQLSLTFPLCVRSGEKITLCRRVGLSWRLAGKASLKTGVRVA